MTHQLYKTIEQHMLTLMNDSAHDKEHIYRVLYGALDIASYEPNVDDNVLITACLLHDIGREKQFKDPSLCHAAEGAKMAYSYLTSTGWSESSAARVRDAIASHRFRSGNPPQSIEAKILFDADKLDVTGAIGIARTFAYEGHLGLPVYVTDEYGNVADPVTDNRDSFMHEYKFKLEKLYDLFFTKRGQELAKKRQQAAADFYKSLYTEVTEAHKTGLAILQKKYL